MVAPSVPTNVRLAYATDTKIAVQWDASTPASWYEITCQRDSDDVIVQKQYNTLSTTMAFFNLQPDTAYNFWVKSYPAYGTLADLSDASSVFTYNTLEAPVKTKKVSTLTDDSALHTLDYSKWLWYGSSEPTITAAGMTLPELGSGYSGFYSREHYDATNDSVYFKVTDVPGLAGASMGLSAQGGDTRKWSIQLSGNVVTSIHDYTGVVNPTVSAVPYDTDYSWYRLRHDGTYMHYERAVNPTGMWQELGKVATTDMPDVVVNVDRGHDSMYAARDFSIKYINRQTSINRGPGYLKDNFNSYPEMTLPPPDYDGDDEIQHNFGPWHNYQAMANGAKIAYANHHKFLELLADVDGEDNSRVRTDITPVRDIDLTVDVCFKEKTGTEESYFAPKIFWRANAANSTKYELSIGAAELWLTGYVSSSNVTGDVSIKQADGSNYSHTYDKWYRFRIVHSSDTIVIYRVGLTDDGHGNLRQDGPLNTIKRLRDTSILTAGVVGLGAYMVRAWFDNFALKAGTASPAPIHATRTPSPSTLPYKIIGGYWPVYQTVQSLEDIDPAYTVVYVFHATPVGGSPGSTGAVEMGDSLWTNAELKTGIAALRARGVTVLLTVGGAGAYFSLANNTRGDAFVASIQTLYTAIGPFDGIDYNLETVWSGDPVYYSQMVRVSQMLRVLYGTSFAFGVSVAGSLYGTYLDHDEDFVSAMYDATDYAGRRLLDLVEPQFYDLWGGGDSGTSQNARTNIVVSNSAHWAPLVDNDWTKIVPGFSTVGEDSTDYAENKMSIEAAAKAYDLLQADPASSDIRGVFHFDTAQDALTTYPTREPFAWAHSMLTASNIIVSDVVTRPQALTDTYTGVNEIGQLEYMRLEEDGYIPLYISPSLGGLWLQDYDLGHGEPRSSGEVRARNDGTKDYTSFTGQKAVSLQFVCQTDGFAEAAYYVDLINSWTRADRRPYLVFKMRGQSEQKMLMRASSLGRSTPMQDNKTGVLRLTTGWVAIDGKSYSSTPRATVQVDVSTGLVDVVTSGTANTEPIITFYGPSKNPMLTNETQESYAQSPNARIGLGGLTEGLADGQFVVFDVKNRTVQLFGESDSSASYRQWTMPNKWFSLSPYHNLLNYISEDGNGYVTVEYTDAWL